MLFDMLNEYVEEGRTRKALKGCLEVAMDKGYINEESFNKLYDILDEYVPADKIETFKIEDLTN